VQHRIEGEFGTSLLVDVALDDLAVELLVVLAAVLLSDLEELLLAHLRVLALVLHPLLGDGLEDFLEAEDEELREEGVVLLIRLFIQRGEFFVAMEILED
jgi:hypothetical protein